MRSRLQFLLVAGALAAADPAAAVDPYAGVDPEWVLLHEPAVKAELRLAPEQAREYLALTDRLDRQFFPLRNKPRDEARAGQAAILAEVRARLTEILRPGQLQRLEEIHQRRLGTQALVRDEAAAVLHYRGSQREQIGQIVADTQSAVAELERQASEGQPREPLQKQFVELETGEQQQILKLLRPDQQAAWRKLIGEPFELDRLGRPAYKAPELVDTGRWINSQPLALAGQRGKVVIVHFYAMGCINCIHNYPSYRKWHEQFRGREVTLLGIQTPETSPERDEAAVRRKAAEEKLAFPILFDGAGENWNAWGNSMWPSVYVLDKAGYLRYFWPGELKWQGADGEAYLTARIEELLKEEAPAATETPA